MLDSSKMEQQFVETASWRQVKLAMTETQWTEMDAHLLAKINFVETEWSTTTAKSNVTLEIILELDASTALSRAEMELSTQAKNAMQEIKLAQSAQPTAPK